jgi:trk system potassium uptake protein
VCLAEHGEGLSHPGRGAQVDPQLTPPLATLVVVLISRRLGLRARQVARAQAPTLTAQDVRRVLRNVVLFSLACEAVAAAVLSTRFALAYDMGPGSVA